MRDWIRIRWFHHVTRRWVRGREVLAWRLANWLPRPVALYAFIRVYAAASESPTVEYTRICEAWHRGGAR